MNHNSNRKLLSSALLARNTVWNLSGKALPLLAGLVSIPIIIKGLGVDGFGLLSIAWMVVGYFSLFDMGLGQSLTKLVSERIARGENEQIGLLARTAQVMLLALGLAGGAVAAVSVPWLTEYLKIPVHLQQEALQTLYILSISIPFVVNTSGLRGVLAAYQRFDLINVIQVFLGLWIFLSPLVVLHFSNRLSVVVFVLVLGRLVALCAYVVSCSRVTPIFHDFTASRSAIKPILSLGGWMTVSNIIGPIMQYMDRFFIGAWISMSAVAYYTTCYEVVTKLSIFPQALMGVLFPAFSYALVQKRAYAAQLVGRAINYLFLLIFPPVIFIVVFAHEGLTWWLGTKFADQGTLVMQWLAIGILLNTPAHIAFSLIQGDGRADWTAYLHLAELPLYLAALWWLTHSYGIAGAAFAWTARVTLDTAILFIMANRLLPHCSVHLRRGAWLFVSSVAVCIIGASLNGIIVKINFIGGSVLVFVLMSWRHLLTSKEKREIIKHISYCSGWRIK